MLWQTRGGGASSSAPIRIKVGTATSPLLGARRIVGNGAPEAAIERRFDPAQLDCLKRGVPALRITDDSDAVGVDKRLARQIEQTAIRIHQPIHGRAGFDGPVLTDTTRAKAVNTHQHITPT